MIRTEELLAARRIDGGRQYFTRAYDFGFTKTLSETMGLWPRDSILKDMVAIVRAYRPHIIISIWSGTPSDGHGQHQYSGVVAREVFDASADTVRFPPAKLGGLPPWSALKFYRSRGFRGGPTSDTFNVGEYDPLLGESYAEIASVSRSQHRSQGQGSVPQLGVSMDGVKLEVSRVSDAAVPERTMFDGIDTSWARFKDVRLVDSARTALDSLVIAQAAVNAARDLMDPSRMVAPLASYVRLVARAASGIDCTTSQSLGSIALAACRGAIGDLALALGATRARGTQALLDAAGVNVEVTAPRELVAEDDTLPVSVAVFNEGRTSIEFARAELTGARPASSSPARPVAPDSVARVTLQFHAASTPSYSWWLRYPLNGDVFNFGNTGNAVAPELIVGEDRLGESSVEVTLRIAGATVTVPAGPIVRRFADRARGEIRRPLATVPAISVLLEHEVEYALANHPFDRTITVHVRSAEPAPCDVDVSLAAAQRSHGRHGDAAPVAQAVRRRRRRLPRARHAQARTRFDHRRRDERRQPLRARLRADRVRAHSSVALLPRVDRAHRVGRRDVRESQNRLRARRWRQRDADARSNSVSTVTELDPADAAAGEVSINSRRSSSARVPTRRVPRSCPNNPALMRFVRDGGTLVVQYGQNEMQRAGNSAVSRDAGQSRRSCDR